MNRNGKSADPVEELDRKIQALEQRRKELEARCRQEQSRLQYQERRARAHRLIGIGAEVESVLGRPILKEELPAFREYMKKAVHIVGAF